IVSFAKAWKSACRAAGCPGRIPHDLRRSPIRNFVRRGISENLAMKLSSHKTSSVFRRYDIVSAGDLRDAARLLDGANRYEKATAGLRRKARGGAVDGGFSRGCWRGRPGLNRGWGFCRPLPYHLAAAPLRKLLERETGFEPATSTLARSHSTTELFPLAPTS